MSLNIIPKGKLFYFSQGKYSDYRVILIGMALKNLCLEKTRDEYLKKNNIDIEKIEFDPTKYIKWLEENGYFREIDSMEFHVCDYDDPKEMRIIKNEGE